MKLLVKTNLIYIVLSTLLLVFGGAVTYFLITATIQEEIDEKLTVNKVRIVEQLRSGNQVTSIYPILEVKVLEGTTNQEDQIKNVEINDPIENDEELFREISTYENINGVNYHIIVRQVILEPHDYFYNIAKGLLIVWVLLLGGFFIVNWMISRRTWKPFKQNLAILKNFKLDDKSPVNLVQTSTREFKDLNIVMTEMTSKLRNDYRLLKEFSENAAHEIQTPLSIIQVRLNDALQSPNLDAQQAKDLEACVTASVRLSKLVRTLLLLGKIENHQFDKKETIRLDQVISHTLEQLDEFMKERNLKMNVNLEEINVVSDPTLMESLINNLLSNAIKYNVDGGYINIDLSKNKLLISNPSKEVEDKVQIFNRFVKGNQSSGSHGLGLAIVKKICDQNGWQVSHNVTGEVHSFEILLNS